MLRYTAKFRLMTSPRSVAAAAPSFKAIWCVQRPPACMAMESLPQTTANFNFWPLPLFTKPRCPLRGLGLHLGEYSLVADGRLTEIAKCAFLHSRHLGRCRRVTDVKVPRLIVAIEIHQGASQISRKPQSLSETRFSPLLAISSALVMSEFESEHIRKS